MAEENTITSANTETTTNETATVVEVAPDPRDNQIRDLQEKLSRFEQMVISPEYAEFLAKRGQQPQEKEYTADERKAFEDRLNNMSRVEFAAFIRDLTMDTVQEKAIKPLMNTMVTREVQTQIDVTSKKYPDFWNYQKEMVAIANANPSLGAEQVYILAKAQKGEAPATPAKPPVRKVGGEVPGGIPAAPSEKPPAKFEDAFAQAFKKAGL